MPVQITPFRGTNLTEIALAKASQANQARQFEQNDRRIGQTDRSLDLQQGRLQQSQMQLDQQQAEQAMQLIPQALGEALEVASKSPEGTRKAAFESSFLPIIQQAKAYNLPIDELEKRLATATEADFGPDVASKYSASMAEFDGLSEGLSPEDRDRARRIKLGLDPRAQAKASAKPVVIGGVPHIFDPDSETYRPAQINGREVDAGTVASSEGTIEAGKAAGKAAIAASEEAREKLGPIRSQISNLEEGIRLLNEGANTGAIADKLPSVTSASKQMDNLRARLGLDVVGSAKFGALSEGELNLALDVALPRGLDEPELKAWLIRKADAMNKLYTELESAAIYLGTPGNTVAGYLERMRNDGSLIGPDDLLTPEEQAVSRPMQYRSSTGVPFTVK